MEQVQVKFGEWLENGFNLYKQNLGTLILASLVAAVLSAVTFGVLLGPMLAGLVLITLGLYDKKEPKPEIGDLFKGFGYFLNSFLFVVIWGVGLFLASFILALVPCIGQLASILLALAVQTFLMFGIFLIVDKQKDFWPASMDSFEKVKSNFWPFLALSVVASIIGGIGAILCGIGAIVTFPIQVCILTVAYREVFNGIEPTAASDEVSQEEKGATDEGSVDDENENKV